MTRRSNRSRGTQAVNMGSALKARSMASMAPGRSRRKAGSESLEDAVRYVFDGVDMYATIPPWSPLGANSEVKFSFIALSAGDGNRYITSDATVQTGWFINSGTRLFSLFYQHSGGQVQRNAGVVTDGVPYDFTSVFKANGAEIQLSGNAPTIFPETPFLYQDIPTIGARGDVQNYHHGPIWGVELIDNSPIQNTDAVVGNGTRYVQLDEPIVLEGDFEIELDWIRQDRTGTTQTIALDYESGGDHVLRLYDSAYSSPDRIQIFFDGGSAAFDNALAGVAQSQHTAVKITYISGVFECFVDGVSKGTNAKVVNSYRIGVLGSVHPSAQSIQPNSAIQNVRIKDITNDREWLFTLDEGAGTDARNTGKTQGNYLGLPMYNTDVLVGDLNRYIDIPVFEVAELENYRISLDCIRRDTATGDALWTMVAGSGGSAESFIYDSTHPTKPNDLDIKINGVTDTIAGAFADVAQGQHFNLVIERLDGNTNRAFIDGVEAGTTNRNGPVSPSRIGARAGGGQRPMAPGAALQNVTLENLTTGEYVQYRIDEGEGTTIKAYDQGGNEIPLGANGVTDSGFEQWTGGVLDNWTAIESGGPVEQETSDVGAGSSSVKINTTGGESAVFQAYTYEEGKRYIAKFKAKASVAAKSANFSPRSGVDIEVPLTTEWADYEVIFTVGATDDRAYLGRFTGGPWFFLADEFTIEEYPYGTVTPDAAWQNIPPYTNDGQWTPDVDWQNFPNNNRHYPMNGAYIDPNTGEIIDIIGGQNGQIQNFNPDNLVDFP